MSDARAEADRKDPAAPKGPARRNTWQKEAVRGALVASDGFLSAQALHARIEAGGRPIGLATVYRTLAALTDAGEIDSLQSVDGEALYRRCRMDAHHHHLICRRCGRAVEITAQPVEEWAVRVAGEHGFADPRHVVDIFGVCSECSAA